MDPPARESKQKFSSLNKIFFQEVNENTTRIFWLKSPPTGNGHADETSDNLLVKR